MSQDHEPDLIVRFETDAKGEPKKQTVSGRNIYTVVFEIKDVPDDVYAATFELDPSYYDPLRTLRPDPAGNIRLETNTYGNYDVNVRLRTKRGETVVLRGNLLDRLRRSSDVQNPAVAEAISYIAQH